MQCKSSFLSEAIARGFFYQATNLEALDQWFTTKGRLAYLGFDATATSLHVGHLLPIFLLRLFQKHGHKPVALIGGGTTKVGDPSFRNTVRPMLTDDEIAKNIDAIKECFSMFLKFGDGPSDAMMINNADWLCNLKYIDFLRDIGAYFSVNRMITFDSVKSKLDSNNSLSFLEFNYMVMQGYDFYELASKINCYVQFGGQDQWGNICAGVELIRKKLGVEVFGFTNPLLLTSGGQKMGKTANGAVWLSKKLLPAYQFWQYWRNVDDADVVRFMYLFTDIPVEDIKKMESIQGAELNDLKKLLADEVTSIVHGREELTQIHASAEGVFSSDLTDLTALSSIEKYKVAINEVSEISIVDILVNSGICSSRGDAKKLIRGKGVMLNNEIIFEGSKLPDSVRSGDFLKLSCGKKKHLIIVIT